MSDIHICYPNQAVSIFRLFGFDADVKPSAGAGKGRAHGAPPPHPADAVLERMNNHLVEVLTGEGKSVTLGVSATVLALLGLHVDCACYSKYLSKRDYDAFASMFEGFGVSQQIQYGTFNR